MNTGDGVKLTERIQTALHDVPPGTGGVVVWANNARGVGCVAFVGHGQVYNVPLAWLVPAWATWRQRKTRTA